MKNIKKTKIILGSVIGLGVVALATVGFSSWIINISNTAVVGQISVGVADVVDKTVTISDAKVDSTNGNFNFGPTYNSNNLIKPTGNASEEDMTFAFTYKVTTEQLDKLTSINAKLELDGTDTANSAFEAAITSNYIVPPLTLSTDTPITGAKCAALNGTSFNTTVDQATSPITCTTTFTFAWGTAFGSKNPAEYATTDNLTTVKTALNELFKANGAKLKITLSSTVA